MLVSGVWGVTAFSGPLLGGILAGWGLWRWAFWIDVPIAVAVGVLGEYALPKSTAPDSGGTKHAGMACGRLALLGAAVLAVAIGGVPGDAVSSGIGLVIGTALLAALLRIEQTSENSVGSFRLLPSGAYRPGNVFGAVSLAMALMVGTTTAVLYLPYVATEIAGYSAVVGGYLSALVSLSLDGGRVRKRVRRARMGRAVDRARTGNDGAWPVLDGVCADPGLGRICRARAFLGWCRDRTGLGASRNLMMSHARAAEHDVSSAFITTNQMIAQAFASALAGMIANLAGFADAALGPIGGVSAIAWLFLWFALMAAAALPASAIAVRLSEAERARGRFVNEAIDLPPRRRPFCLPGEGGHREIGCIAAVPALKGSCRALLIQRQSPPTGPRFARPEDKLPRPSRRALSAVEAIVDFLTASKAAILPDLIPPQPVNRVLASSVPGPRCWEIVGQGPELLPSGRDGVFQTIAAHFSPIMIEGALVLPPGPAA